MSGAAVSGAPGRTRAVGAAATLLRRPSSAAGTLLVLVFLALALLGPAVAPYGPTEQLLAERSLPPGGDHLLGTDHLGRDVFSRIVHGARDIFLLAGLGTLLAVLAGTAVGLVASWRGGWVEEVVFRAFDSLLAMPALLLALLLLGTLGRSRQGVLLVIAIAYVPIVARVVRSVVLSVKDRDYLAAARMQGERTSYLLLRQVLPSVLPALAVEGALRFSYAIFLVASLGFLGVGVQPPNPDWGLMVNEARNYAFATPWALYAPAGAISLLVIGVNLMADGLKRVLQVGDAP